MKNRWNKIMLLLLTGSVMLGSVFQVYADTDEGDYYAYDLRLFDEQPDWSGTVQSEAAFEAQLQQFPESYRAGLRSVHAVYPNYTFSADYVDMDFQELVDYEIDKKVSAYYSPSYKAMYDSSFGRRENYNWSSGQWYNSEGMFTYTSREVIEYYIDPRNFLDPLNIYMFMKQSYSSDQTLDNLRSIIDGTFLAEGYSPNTKEPNDARLKGDYGAVIMEAGRINGLSPYVLAASILIEHGYWGETPLISGYYKANDGTVYKSYFNFFDIGATGSDSNNVIQNGLEYAKAQGWTSRYLSIVNGAAWIVDGYTNNGQDTYYYKEFNVINGWNNLWHQFSTGVMSAWGSAMVMRDALSSNKNAALAFRIPVYTNMPEVPPAEPPANDKLNNYYFTDMYAEGLTPSYTMANRSYSLAMDKDAVLELVVPATASYESAASFSVAAGSNQIRLKVRSETGYLRTYTIQVNASKACKLTVHVYQGNDLLVSDYLYRWVKENGAWYLYDRSNQKLTGWQKIHGKWYYLDSDGVMQTGWVKVKGSWYYMNSSGVMLTGWQKIKNKWYYLKGGKMATGWVKSGGKWYYLASGGAMKTGWVKVNDAWYYLNESGVMMTGWQKIGNKWYYLDKSGVMLTGSQTINGKTYVFADNGVWQENIRIGWVKTDGQWYYYDETGTLKTGWIKVNDSWYYLNEAGVMQTGWVKVNGNWYYLKAGGVMATGWQKIGEVWYYLKPGGAMATGWQKVGEAWYYLGTDGVMVTGTRTIGNKTYQFDDNGVWIE